jgi:hypothetical protein
MSAAPTFSRADWERLVAGHQEVIRLANELEYHVYSLGEVPPHPRVSELQQAAGTLIGHLRGLLFRHDQQVLPVLEALSDPAGGRESDPPSRQVADPPASPP